MDSRRLFSREYDFPKTFSLTQNKFSGMTYFYTIGSCRADMIVNACSNFLNQDMLPLNFEKDAGKKAVLRDSGQTEALLVRFRPKISVRFDFGFGISVFSLFGVLAKTLFPAEVACFGRITLFRPIFARTLQYKVNCQNSLLWPK